MTDQQIKEAYLSRVRLEGENRLFVCDQEVKETYGKKFNLVHPDVRLLQFSNDRFGMTSDCYILYAIAHLGCCTKDTIIEFLSAVQRQSPSLRIVATKENLNERLRFMYGLGLVMRYNYSRYIGKDKKQEIVSLYTTTEDGVSIVRQHLKKRLTLNAGFYAKHICDLIGWGCASRIGAICSNRNRGFVEYCDGVLRTKQMGALFFPCEWKSRVDGNAYYVAFMSSYLEFDSSYMTKNDYENCWATAVNTIRNYINCRTTKGMPCVVVVVQDNKDLNELVLNIVASGAMADMYDNIFFTGEGLIDTYPEVPKKAFLQLRADESAKDGYALFAVEAPFIS